MLKPQKLKATYSIEISQDLYEEIRINEVWDQNGVSARLAWPIFNTLDCRQIDWYTVNQSVERKIPKGVPYQATFLRNPWSITMVSVSEYEEIYNEELGVFHRE